MPLAYNSTIAKKKVMLDCGHLDYNFSRGRCHACSMQQRKPIPKISDKRMNMMQEDDLQGLYDDLDNTFSKYIRIRDADAKGVITCYGCGTQKRWQDAHCSHFMPRANLATRWMPENAAASCVGCNTLGRGRLDKFEQYLESRHKGIVDYLREQGCSVYKPSRIELKELLVELRVKLRTAQTKLIH